MLFIAVEGTITISQTGLIKYPTQNQEQSKKSELQSRRQESGLTQHHYVNLMVQHTLLKVPSLETYN